MMVVLEHQYLTNCNLVKSIQVYYIIITLVKTSIVTVTSSLDLFAFVWGVDLQRVDLV